jgi:YihY family inner membrane protein
MRSFFRLARVFVRYFLRRLYNRWTDDNVYFSAAAISFNFLVTAIPLALLIITLSGFGMQGSGELRDAMRSWVDDAGPLIPARLTGDMEKVVFSGTGITGLLGLLSLFWLVSRLFGTIRTAFDRIFDVASGRHPILGKLYDFLLALLVSVCFAAAFLTTTVASLVKDAGLGRVASQWPLLGNLIGTGSAVILGYVFTTLLFFTLYWAAPNRRVSIRQAMAATFIAVVLSWAGTRLYVWSIKQPDWGVVYGSLAAIMATFLWLYLICVILLAAAEMSQILHEWTRVRKAFRGMAAPTVWVETVAE